MASIPPNDAKDLKTSESLLKFLHIVLFRIVIAQQLSSSDVAEDA